MSPVADLQLSEDLIEDMWLGVSVASQGPPGGRVLVSLCSHWLIKLSLISVAMVTDLNPDLRRAVTAS